MVYKYLTFLLFFFALKNHQIKCLKYDTFPGFIIKFDLAIMLLEKNKKKNNLFQNNKTILKFKIYIYSVSIQFISKQLRMCACNF